MAMKKKLNNKVVEFFSPTPLLPLTNQPTNQPTNADTPIIPYSKREKKDSV